MNRRYEKQYIGDGVYAQFENGMIRLTTENGICVTNEIYLDDTTLFEFGKYLERNFGFRLEPVLEDK